MSEVMLVKEAAKLWNLTERRVTALCKEGRIEGARKEGRAWVIPADAKLPQDNRVKTGKYKKDVHQDRLPLPVGVSDYRRASSKYYYIDKTMMIKDILDEGPVVSLFTRPRRFGKTLNMNMLRTFFEKTDEDTSVYFKDKKIWACGKKYREYQGKYPVIFVTFKDVKFRTWEEAYAAIKNIFVRETYRHPELQSSDKCDQYDKKQLKKLLEREVSEWELTDVLRDLSRMLYKHHGVAPILIIDEYDTPIQQGYMRGYYDEVILFMRNLFSGGLKDNQYLSFGFLTGILRVAKESIFSGMNNLVVHSVLDRKYSSYFGFTPDEVKEMADYYGAAEKYGEICEWYDGYQFGTQDIFNPWSVINYFSNECIPKAFWQATGSNDIIGEILSNADKEIYDRLTALVSGRRFLTYIDTSVIYPQIKKNPSTIYSFLVVAGYLKVLNPSPFLGDGYMCEVAVPNKEILFAYNKEILQQLEPMIPMSSAVQLHQAMYSGDSLALQKQIQTLLMRSVSYFDTAGEDFYHGFMLGLCVLTGGYYVTSNRESGEGRYDIQLMPENDKLPGILIELKAAKNCTENELKKLAENALQQIEDMKYDTEMQNRGINMVYKYGVAFCGKSVEIMIG